MLYTNPVPHHHHCHHHNKCSCGYCFDCGKYIREMYPPYSPYVQPWPYSPYYPNYPTWIQYGNQTISSSPGDSKKYYSINTSCNHH